MVEVELMLYEFTRLFLWPVMLLIVLALGYALFSLGIFLMEAWQRRRTTHRPSLFIYAERFASQHQQRCHSDDLELWIISQLETLRLVTRVAPMLGLVATMIAIGPALLALGEGEISQVSSNMVSAFSAVILSLLAASISFTLMTLRRRWLLQALRQWERQHHEEPQTCAS